MSSKFDKYDFPFWRKTLPPPNVMFENLHKKPTFSREKNKLVVHRKFPEDYVNSDGISNHFTQYARINAKFGDKPTPLETWNKIKGKLSMKVANDPDQAREAVYSQTREANIFNPALALSLIKNAQKILGKTDIDILDPSSGWGDRLIAFYSSGAKSYLGFDPNKNLKEGYQNIMKTFGTPVEGKIRPMIYYHPFEEADIIIKDRKFDSVLTSPPYFNLEIYVQKGDKYVGQQSVEKYPILEDWIEKMYKVYLETAVEALKPGGVFYIYVEDVYHKGKIAVPMRSITETIMNNLSMIRSGDDDVGFIMHNPNGHRKSRTRWALCWKKDNVVKQNDIPDIHELNSEVVWTKFTNQGRNFFVFRDDMLYAGTKQRGVYQYMKKLLENGKYHTVVYSGSFSGYGPVAASLGAKLCGVKCVVILDPTPVGSNRKVTPEMLNRYETVKKCIELGAEVVMARNWGHLKELAIIRATKEGVLWLKLGLDDELYIQSLGRALREDIPDIIKSNPPPFMWVVGGVGVLTRALMIALPTTHMNVVMVSHSEKRRAYLSSKLSGKNVTLYDHAKISRNIPYDTVLGYDSLAWDAAIAYGKSGDCIWNTASAKFCKKE